MKLLAPPRFNNTENSKRLRGKKNSSVSEITNKPCFKPRKNYNVVEE